MLGYEAQSEVATDKVRIDVVITTKKYIYVFEIKLGSSGAEALQQIESRRYFERYMLMGKKIVLVGIAFNAINKRLTFDCASKEIN